MKWNIRSTKILFVKNKKMKWLNDEEESSLKRHVRPTVFHILFFFFAYFWWNNGRHTKCISSFFPTCNTILENKNKRSERMGKTKAQQHHRILLKKYLPSKGMKKKKRIFQITILAHPPWCGLLACEFLFLWPFRSRNIANKRITATQQNESVRSVKNTSNLIRCPFFFFKEKPYEIKRNFLCINNEKKTHLRREY